RQPVSLQHLALSDRVRHLAETGAETGSTERRVCLRPAPSSQEEFPMSMDPEYDRVATLDHPSGQELLPPGAAPVVAELPAPVIEAPAPVAEPFTVTPVKQARQRPRWLVPAAIAAVGLIASGALG